MPALPISTGCITFEVQQEDGTTKKLSLDLTLAVKQIGELLNNTSDEDKAKFVHVEGFRNWVQAQSGVLLGLGQADELMDVLESTYLDAKKKRSWQQNLPSSTPSIPS
jgi:hypothetical protein